MPEHQTLTEALPGYPADHPQTLKDLLDAPPDTLNHPLAWFLRKQAVEVNRSAELHYINSPTDAFTLLQNRYALHPWESKWVSYGLSERRQIVQVTHPRGGTQSLAARTALLPKAEDLPRLPQPRSKTNKQPAWLIVFGGDPAVLSKPGVARGLATLGRRVPVADVLFYRAGIAGGAPPALWSLRAGKGQLAGGTDATSTLEFPDSVALETARSSS